jgi:hypothetical protein
MKLIQRAAFAHQADFVALGPRTLKTMSDWPRAWPRCR